MKALKIKPLNLVFNIVVLAIVFSFFNIAPILSIPCAFVTGSVLSLFRNPESTLSMAIQKDIWSGHLIENYWSDNAFARQAVQCAQEFIYGGKVVHQTAVGGRPSVSRNLTNFPVAITTREDIDVLYAIDEFFVHPWLIKNAENYELDYNKRQSVIGEQSSAANQTGAEWLLRHWFKYSQINTDGSTTTMTSHLLKTTGEATAAHFGTGNRKSVLVKDFKSAKVFLNSKNVPFGDRYAVIDSDMLDQLTQDPEYKKAEKIYEQELIEGTVAKIQGFHIYERNKALYLNSDGTALTVYGAEPQATDNGGAILWHKNGVETAIGDVEFFEEKGKADYYGDVYSALLRASGRIRRADSVITLCQDAAL